MVRYVSWIYRIHLNMCNNEGARGIYLFLFFEVLFDLKFLINTGTD